MFTNRECNWTSVILIIIFLLFILALILWATSKSKPKNCCNSKLDFQNCKAYFKGGIDMNSENNYKKVCNKS